MRTLIGTLTGEDNRYSMLNDLRILGGYRYSIRLKNISDI